MRHRRVWCPWGRRCSCLPVASIFFLLLYFLSCVVVGVPDPGGVVVSSRLRFPGPPVSLLCPCRPNKEKVPGHTPALDALHPAARSVPLFRPSRASRHPGYRVPGSSPPRPEAFSPTPTMHAGGAAPPFPCSAVRWTTPSPAVRRPSEIVKRSARVDVLGHLASLPFQPLELTEVLPEVGRLGPVLVIRGEGGGGREYGLYPRLVGSPIQGIFIPGDMGCSRLAAKTHRSRGPGLPAKASHLGRYDT